MIWFWAAILFGASSLLLLAALFHTWKRLDALSIKNRKYSLFQKSFSSAVAGIEASLEKEKENSSSLLKVMDRLADGVALIDSHGNLTYCNAALWTLYDIAPVERRNYLGCSWIYLHSPKGQKEIQAHVIPELELRNVWHGETDLLTQNGRLLRAELHISKTEFGYLGFIRDVTSRFVAERDRQVLLEQLKHAEKTDAVERVVRAMIHDFTNGLSAVSGFAEIIADPEMDNDAETVKTFADRIYHASQQMQGLLEQVRFLIPKKRQENTSVGNVITELSTVIGELKKRLSCKFEIEQNIQLEIAEVQLEPAQIRQILLHVLQNSIESYDGDEASINLSIKLSKEPGLDYNDKKKYVEICIEDHGSGIPTDVLDHVFNPFFSTKKGSQQRGLGLSIVNSILKNCSGHIRIDSREGEGTKVQLLLPCAKGADVSGSHSTTEDTLPLQ